MKSEQKGWVVINENHLTTGQRLINDTSFAYTKSLSIANFISGSGQSWRAWKKWNFKCVRATRTVTIDE